MLKQLLQKSTIYIHLPIQFYFFHVFFHYCHSFPVPISHCVLFLFPILLKILNLFSIILNLMMLLNFIYILQNHFSLYILKFYLGNVLYLL